MDFNGKKVIVIGKKSSGTSVTTLLKREGAYVHNVDKETESEVTVEEVIKCDMVVPSPGVPPTHPILVSARKYGKKILGELEIGCRFLPCKKIMVTGTNGKTTVVTMIEKILLFAGKRAKSMGNIGYPVSQVVLDGTELDWAVIEVSSFQLEYIEELHPDIAVVTNLAPDHMDRYSDFAGYVATKKKLIKNMTEKDVFLYNADDGNVRTFVVDCKAKCVPVSLCGKSTVYIKDNYYMMDDHSVCHVKTGKLRGEHNRFNLLCAMTVGYECGVRKEHMYRLVKEYTLLPNRIEYVATIDGIAFFNDSKGTNVHACQKALDSVDGNVGLILGGSSKREDFCEFFENINDKVKLIAVTGDNASSIYNAAMKMGFSEIAVLSDMASAVKYLVSSKRVDTVLLSPASASFDRYKSYSERGEKFKEIVYALKK